MFLVQSHVDLLSTFGGEANVTLYRLLSGVQIMWILHDTFKYPSINDITRDHGLV